MICHWVLEVCVGWKNFYFIIDNRHWYWEQEKFDGWRASAPRTLHKRHETFVTLYSDETTLIFDLLLRNLALNE